LEFKELKEAEESVRNAFFAQPLLVPFLSTASHPVPFAAAETAEAAKEVAGEIILGVTKDNRVVKEPLSLFSSTIVAGGDEKERLHVIHLLIEGALLSNAATIVIDWKNSFEGLSSPMKNLQELKKFKVEIEPIGFPIKEFAVPQDVKVDLNNVNGQGLVDAFGVGENIVSNTIVELVSEGKLTSIQDLLKKVQTIKTGGDWNEFQKRKAMRVLKIMDLRYPNLFDGENKIEEIAKIWVKGIGRAGIVLLEGLDNRATLLVLQSLIAGMKEHFKKKGSSKKLRAIIVIPSAQNLMPTEGGILQKQIIEDIIEMRDYGIGFVLGAPREVDLAQPVRAKTEARASIIKGNDVGISLRGRKSYRVFVRPGLSECSELK